LLKKPGWILVVAQFALLITLVLLPDQAAPTQSIYLMGRALAIFALFALVVAAFFLRPSLTALPEPRAGAPFITNGIYRYIRHPMYSALILFGVGAALYKWSIYAVLVALGLFVVLNIKYRYEDSLLRAKWPEAADYQKRVGALFPKSIRPTYK
jgi:protein-S-isoprenylcysteine O-methyltransferase Ste14